MCCIKFKMIFHLRHANSVNWYVQCAKLVQLLKRAKHFVNIL